MTLKRALRVLWKEERFLVRFWTAFAVLLPLALLIQWLVQT